MKKLISIITPVYNEEENVYRYYEKITKSLKPLEGRYDFEFIITDNRSTDNTYDLFVKIAKMDKRFHIIRFSRNFGYQKSILTGYLKSRGDAAIEFDCDLQDPPDLLPFFLSRWSDGYKVVYGIRKKRQESPFVTLMRKAFYRTINRISATNLPHDAGDFMLLDRAVIDQLRSINDRDLYLRGVIFEMGFKKCGLEYNRTARQNGTSKFPIGKMVSLAIDGLISNSLLPLRISYHFGMLVAVFFAALSGIYLFGRISGVINMPPGFATTTLLLLFSISINAIFLGVIGEYVGRIYLQLKARSMTIIEDEFNPNTEQDGYIAN